MNAISRRILLKRIVLAAAIGVLPASLRRTPRAQTHVLAPRLLACLSRRTSARLLGERYLLEAPQETDAALIATRIAGSARRARALATMDTSSLRRLLAEQQRRDFAAGRTVNVNGWVLSRTEAQLCALAAIERGIG